MPEALAPVIELVAADVPKSDVPVPHPVATDVNWRIEPGTFWAVGAIAGTGKTDLLLTTAGLQRPIRGEILLFGKSIAHMGEEEMVRNRLRVAMVFTDGRLFSDLTVAQNIGLPLEYHGHGNSAETRELIEFALDAAELTDLAGKRPREIPRSLHQRVALARSIALRPDVLVVDNPLLAIDQRNTRWWIDFLCAANTERGPLGKPLTIVVATDDFRPWIDAARDFGVLHQRHFEIIGGRDQVKASSEPLVRDLLTAAFDDL